MEIFYSSEIETYQSSSSSLQGVLYVERSGHLCDGGALRSLVVALVYPDVTLQKVWLWIDEMRAGIKRERAETDSLNQDVGKDRLLFIKHYTTMPNPTPSVHA